ncbi:hypothetical protein ACFOEW_17225 [Alteromonas oceani]|uniref:Membrane-associated oxidoreductase n=1 Tax=Alteromonas oceani TaxID=2071609 RepID=A0ABV7JZL6_9ALTE|nr:hypothetical protein [Alteromonas oceani]
MNYKSFHCVFTEPKHSRFSVLINENKTLYFVYWLELKKLGIRHLGASEELCAQFSPKPQKTIERGLALESAVCFEQPSEFPDFEYYIGETFSQEQLSSLLQKDVPLIVFRQCTFGLVNIEGLSLTSQCAFFDCEFADDFRLIACDFPGNLWFCSSRFNKHFSLKSSGIQHNLHMESCNFSGPGGVSLRGLIASNVYLDFGVMGCEDIIWLNEVAISGVVSIGGTFHNDIEVIGNQDQETETSRGVIKAFYAGRELYDSETANTTILNGKLKIKDCDINTLFLNNTTVQYCSISQTEIATIHLTDATIVKDLSISQTTFIAPELPAISMQRTSIERHLRLFNNCFVGNLALQNSTIDGNAYIEDNQLEACNLQLNRLSAARLVFLPINDIYVQKRHFPLSLEPRQFIVQEQEANDKTAELYCSLKNWFSDTGQLDAEDDAYFFMRQKQPHFAITRLLFGHVFGWGVRLRNIAISSTLIILLFMFLFRFCQPDMSWHASLALSVQGFTGNFFGKWPDYEPSGNIAALTVFESVVGIVFITVFIGAYIRKLLR